MSIVDLQCYVKYCCTTKWLSFIYIYIYVSFHVIFHYVLSQDTEYSSLCCVAGPRGLPIIHTHTHTHTPVCVCLCPQSHPTLLWPSGLWPARLLCHGIFQARVQEYWSGLPFPTPEDLPHPRMEPTSLESPALAGRFFNTSATWEGKTHQFASSNPKFPIPPSPTPLPLATTNVFSTIILLIKLFLGIFYFTLFLSLYISM